MRWVLAGAVWLLARADAGAGHLGLGFLGCPGAGKLWQRGGGGLSEEASQEG
jgi:hypothetical protein